MVHADCYTIGIVYDEFSEGDADLELYFELSDLSAW